MRGLIGRESLAYGECLFLQRTRSVHTFGMRFPIEVALLGDRFEVRAVVRLQPRRLLLPRRSVRHILELQDRGDLRLGDRLRVSQ
jgi:uncharacterized protein